MSNASHGAIAHVAFAHKHGLRSCDQQFRGSITHPTRQLCMLRGRPHDRYLTQHSLPGGSLRLTWAGLPPADRASFLAHVRSAVLPKWTRAGRGGASLDYSIFPALLCSAGSGASAFGGPTAGHAPAEKYNGFT